MCPVLSELASVTTLTSQSIRLTTHGLHTGPSLLPQTWTEMKKGSFLHLRLFTTLRPLSWPSEGPHLKPCGSSWLRIDLYQLSFGMSSRQP